MRLGHFEVNICGRHERQGGYVVLDHSETYTLELINHDPRCRAEATVQIDGKEVGTWRLSASQTIRIERPVNEAKMFTFYHDGTDQSRTAGIVTGDSENGHIAVTFVAEKERSLYMESDSFRSAPLVNSFGATAAYCSGGTGLSGHSNQTFRTVSGLDKDRSTTTTIHLRLVGDSGIHPLQSIHTNPPLSNPIPVPAHSYGFFN